MSVLEYLQSIDKADALRDLVAKHLDAKDVDEFLGVLDEPNNEPLDFEAAERICAFSRVRRGASQRLYSELCLFFLDLGYKLKKLRGQTTKLTLPPPEVEKEPAEGETDDAKRVSFAVEVEAAFTTDAFRTPDEVATAFATGVKPERVRDTLRKIVEKASKSGTLVPEQRGEAFRLRRTRKWYTVRKMQIPDSALPIPSSLPPITWD